MTYRPYTFTIAAGAELAIQAQGMGLFCKESNLEDFQLAVDGEPLSGFFRGAQLEPPGGFHSFRVKNPNSVGLTVTIGVYGGGFADRRVILPVVQRILALDGGQFIGTSSTSPTASQYSSNQLSNPSGSGKIVIPKQLMIYSATAGNFVVYRSTDTVLTNDRGWRMNKRFGGDAPSAETLDDTNATLFASRSSDELRLGGGRLVDKPLVWVPKEELAIDPGYQLTVTLVAVNVDLNTVWEWEEADG